MGVLLPFYSHLEEDADWGAVYMAGSANGRSHKVFRLRNTAGYNAAVGIAPKLDKHMALFAEINIQSMAILARHSELTSDLQNGVEKIGTYTTYAKETDYVKKTDGNYQYSDNKPAQQLTFSFPYSSIGIHIGVSFKL
jgi:hypothetical protein